MRLAVGVASKSVKLQRPARATVCSHSQAGRDRQFTKMLAPGDSALNRLNTVGILQSEQESVVLEPTALLLDGYIGNPMGRTATETLPL